MGTIGFFNEDANTRSMMRLESFLVLIFFFLLNSVVLLSHIKALTKGCDLPAISDNFLWFDVILLTFAFFPKVAQKLIEAKFNVPPTSDTTTKPV